jgi:hypothetical protein
MNQPLKPQDHSKSWVSAHAHVLVEGERLLQYAEYDANKIAAIFTVIKTTQTQATIQQVGASANAKPKRVPRVSQLIGADATRHHTYSIIGGGRYDRALHLETPEALAADKRYLSEKADKVRAMQLIDHLWARRKSLSAEQARQITAALEPFEERPAAADSPS